MSKRNPKVRLLHMRDYARKAIDMAKNQKREDVDRDVKLCLALTHLVELIGEAASQIPSEVQAKYPDIPWKEVIGTRHRLIHGYDIVDYDILWETIIHDLPELLSKLELILGEDNS